MNWQYTMYREVLKEELAARSERNPRYSLRAFARDIDMLPSRLSDILNGKQGMSVSTAVEVAKKIGLSDPELQRFATSVEAAHARSPRAREAAKEELERQDSDEQYKALQEDIFALVSDWYHFAILDLTVTEDFTPDLDWIADRLGITRVAAELAVRRLENVGLLQREKNKWLATTTFPASPTEIPSGAIKKFHTQILDRASRALFLQPIEERDFSANTMAIDPTDLPEIKKEIKKFRRSLERRYKKKSRKREVYCLSTQLFSLTRRKP